MAFIKFFVIFVLCFAAYSLTLWLLGLWSRRSVLGKIVSMIFIVLSALALAAAYFVRPNIGTLTVSANKGIVRSVEEIDLSANIKLDKYNQNGNSLFVYDIKGRNFFARIPPNVSGPGIEARLFPIKSFLISPMFVIIRISSLYIVATWGKLGAFIMSFLAVMIVWAAGTEGKFAYLLPSADD